MIPQGRFIFSLFGDLYYFAFRYDDFDGGIVGVCWELFYEEVGAGEPDRGAIKVAQKAVVKALAVSEAVSVFVKCDRGDDAERFFVGDEYGAGVIWLEKTEFCGGKAFGNNPSASCLGTFAYTGEAFIVGDEVVGGKSFVRLFFAFAYAGEAFVEGRVIFGYLIIFFVKSGEFSECESPTFVVADRKGDLFAPLLRHIKQKKRRNFVIYWEIEQNCGRALEFVKLRDPLTGGAACGGNIVTVEAVSQGAKMRAEGVFFVHHL